MWTIDLWSELSLEVVSIEATKIATYFLKKFWFEREVRPNPSNPLSLRLCTWTSCVYEQISGNELMLFTHKTTCCLMVESINFVQVTNL